jgi:predicted alpha/beta-hydrolase family hydrolase
MPATERPVFVCAHGAGGHKDDRAMLALAGVLDCFEVVRFNFPYREKGSSRIDPVPVLKNTIKEVAEGARRNGARLFLGGRSMGGRMASMLVADGFACDGLLLFAYPLHPAGKPEKLRTEHLPRITAPVLCMNGTRDPLCTRALMEPAIAALPRWTMHWLEDADHSFHVLKASGRSDGEVMQEVGAAARRWSGSL